MEFAESLGEPDLFSFVEQIRPLLWSQHRRNEVGRVRNHESNHERARKSRRLRLVEGRKLTLHGKGPAAATAAGPSNGLLF